MVPALTLIISVTGLVALVVWLLRYDQRRSDEVAVLRGKIAELEGERLEPEVLSDVDEILGASGPFVVPLDEKTIVLRFHTLTGVCDFSNWVRRERANAWNRRG